MKKRGLGISTVLAGMLSAGTAQAVEFDFELALPADGYYSNAVSVVTSTNYNGATFDLVYNIDSIADGSNSFVYSAGGGVGVGSDSDIQPSTVDGDTGDGLSFTSLSISNFTANDSGLELSDFSDLKFTVLSLNNVGNTRDGITVSFTGYSTNSENYTLNSAGTGGISGETAYPLDLTSFSIYETAETNLYIENDSASGSDRWIVVGLTVSIDLPTDGNLAPEADAQSITMFPGSSTNITLTGSDPEGSSLTYTVADYPVNGLLEGSTNSWTYTPADGYQGSDSFTFTVSDGEDVSEPATVSIIVTNEVPTATAQSVEVYRNESVSITLSGDDADSGPSNLTYTVDDSLLGGTLTGTAPDLIYTPETDYTGEDRFTFTVNDGLEDSDAVTVTITVLNNPPDADPKIVFTESDTSVGITLSGSDVEDSSLSFTVESLPANGFLTGTEPDLTYTPTNGFTGTDSFTYSAYDGESTGDVAAVSIIVSDDGFTLTFEDLDSALSNNTLNVGGIPAEVAGVSTNAGSDYFYSAVFTGADIDGDGVDDSIAFDVLVEAWSGGVVTNNQSGSNDAGGSVGTNGTAVIGTTDTSVVIGSSGWGAGDTKMQAGETLEFTLMNIEVSLTDGAQLGSASGSGFMQTYLVEVGSGYGHQTVIGEGTELLEIGWNNPGEYSVEGFTTGEDPLYISQAAYTAVSSNPQNWAVQDVGFGITITLRSSFPEDISASVVSAEKMVFSWEGVSGVSYGVQATDNLAVGTWTNIITGITGVDGIMSVTNEIDTTEVQQFFRTYFEE